MTQKKNSVKVAVVGVGYLGRFHADKYAAMDDVTLVGVVDSDPDCAGRVAEACGTVPFTDHRSLLGKVDAVSVVVPTRAHFDVARDFLISGSDVMVEKPMTETIAQADDLIRLARENERILQVGHLERFNPAVVAVEDKIGRPLFIESHRLSLYKGRGIDVSVVHDLMIHDIDIICHLVASPVSGIHASGASVITPHVDIANARLEFDNGCVANITASRISLKNERKIRIFQKDAYLSVDFAAHQFTHIRRNHAAVDSPIPGMEISCETCETTDALNAELVSFVDAVKHRRPPVVTGTMGRDALKIAMDVVAQIEQSHHRHFGGSEGTDGNDRDR